MTPRNIRSSGSNVTQIVYKYFQDLLNSIPPDTDLNEAKKNIYETVADFISVGIFFPFLILYFKN